MSLSYGKYRRKKSSEADTFCKGSISCGVRPYVTRNLTLHLMRSTNRPNRARYP